MLKGTVCASLLVFLFAASYVRGRRVIRAAEHAEKSGCYIVKLHNYTSHEVFERTLRNALDRSDDLKVYARSEGVFKFFTVKLPEWALDEVKDLESVEYIEEETMARGTAVTFSWAMDRIDQISAIRDNMYNPGAGRDGQGIDIYVLDTGIRYNHSEFGGRAVYPGFDPVDDYEGTDRQGQDCHGHGTHVASLAVGKLYGVAKKATVYSVRVLACDNGAPWSTILSGLDLVADKVQKGSRRAVVSMSLGGSYTYSANEAVKGLTDVGIPVVVSAGNSNADACWVSPGSAPSAVTVAGTSDGDAMYFYSNGGSCVDIFAPANAVRGADFSTSYGEKFLSGNSMATPIVGGVLAIYLQEQPLLTVVQLTELMIHNSLKGVLDLRGLEPFGLLGSTPNRFIQVKHDSDSSVITVTSISTITSTTRVTETLLPMTVTQTIPPTTLTMTIPPLTTTKTIPPMTVTLTETVSSIVTIPPTTVISTITPNTVTKTIPPITVIKSLPPATVTHTIPVIVPPSTSTVTQTIPPSTITHTLPIIVPPTTVTVTKTSLVSLTPLTITETLTLSTTKTVTVMPTPVDLCLDECDVAVMINALSSSLKETVGKAMESGFGTIAGFGAIDKDTAGAEDITSTITMIPTAADHDKCDIPATIVTLTGDLQETVEETMESGLSIIANIVGPNGTYADVLRLGFDESMPAESCEQLLQVKPFLESGSYWMEQANGSVVSVYCKMEEINGRRGLMRVAEIDMSQPGSQCPGDLGLTVEPMRMCGRGRSDIGCSTAMFSAQGIPYKTVCGRVHAIQHSSPNAFFWYKLNPGFTIDDLYVDGVILSRMNAKGNRSHVWTFSAALDEVARPGYPFACPCTNSDDTVQVSIPPFVGEDYFCETGSRSNFQYGRYYVEDPLWDGQGCGPKSTCCNKGNYFCKTFDMAVTDDIELRLCGNEIRSNEDTPITLLELYTQ